VKQNAVTTQSETITHYVYTTATVTYSGIVNIVVSAPSPSLCGTSEYVPISGKKGDNASIASTLNIDIFVFPDVNSYLAWSSTHDCNFDKVDGTLIKQHAVRAFSFFLPKDNPVLAFLNTSHAQTASVTVTQKSVATSIGLLLTTHIISSVRTLEPSFNVTFNLHSPFSLALIALLAGALIVVAILTVHKRKDQSIAEKTERHELEIFCINCGAGLPPDSTFCNKCGSAQSYEWRGDEEDRTQVF
jgi:ribosomal protein L40E